VIPARVLRHFHAGATVVWLALLAPTLLWWRESVLWVAVMSLYANFAAHFAAWQAARAETKDDS